MKTIETERLIIRPPEMKDFESSFEIWGNSEVQKFSGGAATREQFEKGFREDLEKAQTNFGFRSVVERKRNTHIGDCGLIEKEVDLKKEIELVYFFNRNYWGSGYASEAAGALKDHAKYNLKLCRLIALIHPENVASKNVIKKVGFTFEKNVITASGNNRELFSLAW